jgi:hypothetical protein
MAADSEAVSMLAVLAAAAGAAALGVALAGAAVAGDGADRLSGHWASASVWGLRELMLAGVRVGAGTTRDGAATPVWAGGKSGPVGVGGWCQ